MRAAEVRVDDQLLTLAANVVLRPGRGDLGTAQVAQFAPTSDRASKIKLAPGMSVMLGGS
jgi:hypothetical protein